MVPRVRALSMRSAGHHLRAVMHDAQAKSLRLLYRRIESAAVVFDAQQAAVAVEAQRYLHRWRMSMLGGVGDRFLGDPVQVQRVH